MKLDTPFQKNILKHIERYQFLISTAGIRYGSVLYLGFGKPVNGMPDRPDRVEVNQYPVEIEIGSDKWIITQLRNRILDSEFHDVRIARQCLSDTLIGKTVISIEIDRANSKISLSDDLEIDVEVAGETATGFLYSLDVKDGPSWETADGITAET